MSFPVGAFGFLAEFDGPDELLAAAKRTHAAGYRYVEAYSPFPVHGLAEAIGFERTRLPLVVLIGGIVGGIAGYALQYWASVIEYPLNIGGRPYHSWPSFIPATFETTVLFAALAAVLGMLALNGLPMPWHPLFAVPRFSHASSDAFFLCIQARDPKFSIEETRRFLEGLGAREVQYVEY